jgi:hypothetical protein
MANIIIYEKDTGKVLSYRESVNTPDFPDALKVESRPTVDLKYLKVVDGKLTEFTKEEKDALTSLELKAVQDAEKAFTDKIDALNDLTAVKEYLKTLRI